MPETIEGVPPGSGYQSGLETDVERSSVKETADGAPKEPTLVGSDGPEGARPSSQSGLETDIERQPVKEGPDAAPKDPNLVDFDGPDDPENPMNWPFWKKAATITLVSMMTLLSYAPSTAPRVPHR